jgi:hypothetical protein
MCGVRPVNALTPVFSDQVFLLFFFFLWWLRLAFLFPASSLPGVGLVERCSEQLSRSQRRKWSAWINPGQAGIGHWIVVEKLVFLPRKRFLVEGAKTIVE